MDKKKLLISCRSQRRSTRWALDFDYLKKLSHEELQFLAEFCHVHYHASPHRCTHLDISIEQKREAYRENYKRQVDVLNNCNMATLLDFEINPANVIEDILICLIDNKNKR